MNLITLDLNFFDQPDFLGRSFCSLKHIGTWLKMAGHAKESNDHMCLYEAKRWEDKDWLRYVGIDRSDVIDEYKNVVCPELWEFHHTSIRLRHIDCATDKVGMLAVGVEISGSYKEARKVADEALRSAKLRTIILNKTNGLCTFCGSDYDICIDHIIPVKEGGSNSVENLQPLCRTCNSKKGAKLMV